MKFNDYTNIICALIIGVAIITSSIILQSTYNNDKSEIMIEEVNGKLKPLVTVEEAADYLGISETEVWLIINFEENSYDIDTRFPIVKIEKNTYVSTSGLLEWLKSSTNEVKYFN